MRSCVGGVLLINPHTVNLHNIITPAVVSREEEGAFIPSRNKQGRRLGFKDNQRISRLYVCVPQST